MYYYIYNYGTELQPNVSDEIQKSIRDHMAAIDQFQKDNAIHLQPHAPIADGAKDSEAANQEAAARKAAHDRFCEEFILKMNRAHRSIRIQMLLHKIKIPFNERDRTLAKKYFLSNWTGIIEYYQNNNKTINPPILEVNSMVDLIRILNVWVEEEVTTIESNTGTLHNGDYKILLEQKVLPIFWQFQQEVSGGQVKMPSPMHKTFAQWIQVRV